MTAEAKNAKKKWSDSWLNDPFKRRLRQEYNVNVSGGGEVTNAYLSMQYLDDNGYVTNSGFNRVSSRLKVEHKVGSNIRVEGNVAYAKTELRRFSDMEESNYSNLFMFSQLIAPIYPIYKYDEDGNVKPVEFSTETLCAFMQTGPAPDEAEYITTVDEVKSVKAFGKSFWTFDVIYRNGDEDSVKIPAFVLQSAENESILNATQLQGLLWLVGYVVS